MLQLHLVEERIGNRATYILKTMDQVEAKGQERLANCSWKEMYRAVKQNTQVKQVNTIM